MMIVLAPQYDWLTSLFIARLRTCMGETNVKEVFSAPNR